MSDHEFASQESEAQRLAEQRTKDIEKGAYERGVAATKLAERLDRMDTSLTGAWTHLGEINGSQAETVTELREIKQQLRDIAKDLADEEKGTALSSARRFTRLQSAGILAMVLLASAALVVSIIQALGHG
jgi:hypothetical protein